jgi:PKD repeat protein
MKYFLLKSVFFAAFVACILNVSAQNGAWNQKASLTADNGRNFSAGFSIGHYGFIGGGETPTGFVNDFWKWNQTNNTWTSIASYPGAGKWGLTSFVINGKAYCCCGWSGSANENDMWEYDTISNTWTQKASFPGLPRYGAFAFVLGTKAYVGCGEPNGAPYYQDMWMYNSVTNTWSAVASFPGGNRTSLIAFTLNGHGYAGCGWDHTTTYTDMWKYDTASNTWTSVAAFPLSVTDGVSFVLDTLAYAGTGYRETAGKWYRDFYKYSSTTNTWTPIATLTGVARWEGVGFSIGNKGYAGVGADSVGDFLQDYWEYTPSPIAKFTENDTLICAGDTVRFMDQSVNFPTSWKWTFQNGNPSTSTKQDTSVVFNTPGIDSVKLVVKSSGGSDSLTVKKCIHVIAKPAPTFTGADSICKGSSEIITIAGASSYLWNNGATTSAIRVHPRADTTYCVMLSNGICSKDTCKTIHVITIPSPSFSAADTVCKFDTTTIKVSGGGTYMWSNGATTSTIVVDPYTDSDFCVKVSNSFCFKDTCNRVHVLSEPSPRFSASGIVCLGDTTTIKVSGGISYLWSTGATTYAIIVSPTADSNFCVSVSNGFCSKDTCILIKVRNCSTQGIGNITDNSDIRIYPNPSNGQFELVISNYQLGMNSTMEVYNVLDEKIYSANYTLSTTHYSLDLSNQPNGIYLYRVLSTNGSMIGEGKLIIAK